MGPLALSPCAFGQAAAAQAREAPARPAAGAAVISYEESRGGAIVYLEEAGGLASQGPRAITPRRAEPGASASPVAAPAARAPATRNARIVPRQVAEADAVAPRR